MKDYIELFVPGRLCLFGEHSDWAGLQRIFNADIIPGRAIVTGIEQGIYGRACRNDRFIVKLLLPQYQGEVFECDMNMRKLRDIAKKGGFFSYVAGVASYICEWYHTGGVELEITDMTVPMKSGMSSSAAICVMVASVFNKLYNLHLNTLGVMNIAYWGEQRTPSRCGRLDQACAFGINPIAMTFDGNEILAEKITVKKSLYYVFADMLAGKDTIKILADLNSGYPFARDKKETKLHEALGEDNLRITERAMKYISTGNNEALGALMIEAQQLFDEKVAPMCPEELTAPVLHKTLNDDTVKLLTYGAKGVGSQGDGTVQFLAKNEECQRKLMEYLEGTLGMKAYSLTLKPNNVVRKAVIPVAGFGTRLYPATRGVKKEFFPVIDKEGFAKPAILVLLEELIDIGIEEICLILNPDEKQYYEDFFMKPLSQSHFDKLPLNMREYEKRIREIASKLRFVFQEEQRGFGHAVYLSKAFADGEPVLLLLGDQIYSSNTAVPCTKQLIDVYEKYGQLTVAVHEVPLNDVVRYGIFAGSWENAEETIIKVSDVLEKPSVESARDFMSVPGRGRSENYYAAFGAYIITPEVYDRLEDAIKNKFVNKKGEIELTDVLAKINASGQLYAFVPDGESYDIGTVEAYRDTIIRYNSRVVCGDAEAQ